MVEPGVTAPQPPVQPPSTPGRAHLTRLMSIWRSAGWPSRDAIELDLLGAGWVAPVQHAGGRETLHLTDAGLQALAAARQRNQRRQSLHDRLAERMAAHLAGAERLVWRELTLRADAAAASAAPSLPAVPEGPGNPPQAPQPPEAPALWPLGTEEAGPAYAASKAWRLVRPDVFSLRQTSVEAYLQPMVHEVKVSRADLLSDLRQAAKRASYRWLCSECYYVFPAHIAQPNEIPADFGVWVLHGRVEDGALELLRPAHAMPCRLPFAVWMALARSTPWAATGEDAQAPL
jgi:hypothetical protein